VISESDFNKRLRPLNLITQVIQELYNYNGLMAEVTGLSRTRVTRENIEQLPLFTLNMQLPVYFTSTKLVSSA
jgi:hypothetical protein